MWIWYGYNVYTYGSTYMNDYVFEKGDKVRYIPTHTHGNPNHEDCENGVVSSVKNNVVFVKYDNGMCIMTTGDEPYTAQATSPEDLIKR